MRNWKRMLAVYIVIVLCVSLFHPYAHAVTVSASVKKTIKLNTSKKTLYVGDSFTIKCSSNGKKVKWSVSNSKVLKVKKKTARTITIEAKNSGKAVVTARVGKIKKKCVIYVKKKLITVLPSRLFPTNTGIATYYNGGYIGGCASLDSMAGAYFVCALNKEDYNMGQMAGAYLQITGPLGTVNALVTDELPEGKKGDIDLNEAVFPMIANKVDGRVPITWKIIPLPTTEPLQYWIKPDSTEYWMQIQVRNHRYPLAKVEMQQKDGSFKELKKEKYNFYTVQSPGKGPFVFRVTDINGQVLTDAISLQPGAILNGQTNFPY